jgi:hypothetical protein
MSNIVPFPTQDNQRVSIEKHQLEIKEQREKNGGIAYDKLKSWRRRIDKKDQQTMARNMESILNEYTEKNKELKWNKHYQSIEDFRRDIYRMRLPGNKDRRLIGHSRPWVNLLGLIADYLDSQGKNASLAFLADRLTRETRFHPIQKEESSPTTKFFAILKTLANQVDEEYGLLKTYREVAEQRAKYFRRYKREISESYRYWFAPPDYMAKKVSDLFLSESDCHDDPFFDEKIKALTQSDWNTIAQLAPDEYAVNLEWRKNEIDEWLRHSDKETTLISKPNLAGFCEANLWFDLSVLPRWFIGYFTFDKNITADSYHWLGEIIDRQGTGDPLMQGQHAEWESMCAYLVLYPDPGLDCIIPYLFYFCSEGSSFYPLQEEDLDESESLKRYGTFFEPKGRGDETDSLSLLVRVEESLYEIRESWNSTAKLLKTHPYLEWTQEREKNTDNFINQLLKPQKPTKKQKTNRRKRVPN